jgi:hypothetical protein
MFNVEQSNWKAHARDIQCDARYFVRWPTNRLLLIRHTVYSLNTNGMIIGADSDWKWVSPF